MAYRVLYLDHAAEMGGAERSLLELLSELKAQQAIDPVVATMENGQLAKRCGQMGLKVLPLSIHPDALHFDRAHASQLTLLIRQAMLWLKPFQQIQAWCHKKQPALIHANTLKMHPLASLLSKITGIPAVWHMRDIPTERGNALRLLKLAHWIKPPAGLISISTAVASSLNGLKGKQVSSVVYNGLPQHVIETAPPFTPEETRQRLGLPIDARLIVCVGYFIPWKGQDTLIKAFSQLYPHHPSWHLVLIGKNLFQFQGEQERLESLARQHRVESRVHFVGEQGDIVQKLPAFDVLVCPSNQEPFGRVLLEAMAAQIPIVATNSGGIPEILTHQKEAWLVPPQQPTAMAEAIEALLNDPSHAVSLVEHARERVKACFSLEQTAAGVLKVYETLLPKG